MSAHAGITARFRGRLGAFALDVAFEAPGRGITVLFGPSGCGKTTTLRCIAGLQRLDGACSVAGETWQDDETFLPPHRRPIGYVFQEASLFAHMSIRRNLFYGRRGQPAADAADEIGFDAVVDLLGLAPLLSRAPARLSGGERQRVAIGRALLSRPRLLLMDEPLSALDRDRREEIMPFLERLHATLSLPILLVTHDMATLERLADHLVLIESGRIVASGPLAAVQGDPDLPLARRRDAAVTLEATVRGGDPAFGIATLGVAGGEFQVPARPDWGPGRRLRIRIAAGDVSLALSRSDTSTILNILPARILSSVANGAHEKTVVLGLGDDGAGGRILARVTRLSWERLGLRDGMTIQAQVKSVALARPG